jgi:hypothetical protein
MMDKIQKSNDCVMHHLEKHLESTQFYDFQIYIILLILTFAHINLVLSAYISVFIVRVASCVRNCSRVL